MEDASLFAIAEAQAADRIFVSPITAWEAALALTKKPARRPDLKGQDAASWFKNGRRQMGARMLQAGLKVGLEAARVPEVYGNGDPGDCYIIATARVHGLAVVTRDRQMIRLAQRDPEYLQVVAC